MQYEIAALEASIEAIKATDSLEGSNRDELSVVPQETANGKRDRILNSMNNSVLLLINQLRHPIFPT